MPINFGGHRAEMELMVLTGFIKFQNRLFQQVRDAKSRAIGLGRESDCQEYQRLSARVQRSQNDREKLRADAIGAGASPKFVRKCERAAEREFSFRF